jgi:hypothetical protein
MRSITKMMLRTCVGLAAAAGLVAGGAGVASAATVSPAAHTSSSWAPRCNPGAREQWNLNGHNTVEAVYQGTTYTYSVTFKQYGGCLTGTLTDLGVPITGPISGTVYRNHVTFSFNYGSTSIQGIRTFTGTINRWGAVVSGTWSETGTEQGTGSFTLAKHAANACPWWQWWNHSCRVFPRR